MLIVEIDGREAVPLRAVPLITHGFIGASALAEGLRRPDRVAKRWHLPDLFPPARRQLSDGTIETLSTLAHIPWARRVRKPVEAADAAELRRLIPRSYFLWRDDFEAVFRAIRADLIVFQLIEADSDSEPDRSSRKTIHRPHLSYEPEISPEERALVMEGFADANKPEGADTGQRPTTKNARFNPEWQRQLDALARSKMIGSLSKPPKKTTLIPELAKKLRVDEGTLARCTRVTWNRRKRQVNGRMT